MTIFAEMAYMKDAVDVRKGDVLEHGRVTKTEIVGNRVRITYQRKDKTDAALLVSPGHRVEVAKVKPR